MSGNRHQFIRQQLLWLVASAAFLILGYPRTGLDFQLITPYFDVISHSFNLKHDPFLTQVMHTGLKYLLVGISVWLAIAWLWSMKSPKLQPRRRELGWTLLAMVVSTLTVTVLKRVSIHGCPYELTMFGGTLPYIPFGGSLPAGVSPGHCFPGGHATGGFALMAFYFAFRMGNPLFACVMLCTSLFLGFAMGWAQMMRGAHFLSHNLWTLWVVWAVMVLLSLIWPPSRLAEDSVN